MIKAKSRYEAKLALQCKLYVTKKAMKPCLRQIINEKTTNLKTPFLLSKKKINEKTG